MSNSNSVAGFAGSGTVRNTFPTQTIATTTPTALLLNTDAGTTTAFIVAPTTGQVYGAQTAFDSSVNSSVTRRSGRDYGLESGQSNDQFSVSTWDGKPFIVRVTGVGNAGANAAQSLIVSLCQGTSATIGSDNLLGTTGAAFAAVAGGAFNFYLEAKVLWDATSQILSGSYTADIAFGSASQFTTTTKIATPVTAVTAANLSFVAFLTLGNAASSTVTVREFLVEKV